MKSYCQIRGLEQVDPSRMPFRSIVVRGSSTMWETLSSAGLEGKEGEDATPRLSSPTVTLN